MPKKCDNRANTALSTDSDSLYLGVLSNVLQNSNIADRDYLLGSVRARNYGNLLRWSDLKSPQMYDSADSYFGEVQVAALIKKYPFSSKQIPGIDPRGTAIGKFKSAEHSCKRYNLRARLKRRRFNRHAQIFEYARMYIRNGIGMTPDIPDILSHCDFTGGANTGVHGNKTNIARKVFARRWTCTPSALPYAVSALWLNAHTRDCVLPGALKCYDPELFRDRVKSKVDLVSCNKLSFVSKTAKTDRSIAVEPLLNGFVQRGAEVFLKRKLRKMGLDLRDQRVNQLLSRAGSLGSPNPYCTIDLSAASDSLAIEVVKDLLPPEWFEFLSDIRSPCYELDNRTYRYEKFCSMGNGFCFPLETLIFASVCYGVDRYVNGKATKDFSVYGDDIVVRQNVALLVIEMLRDIGFKVNTDKTFITGPFRESCGSDWYGGQDVRPVHLKKRMLDIRHVFAFHNSTLRSPRTELCFEEARQYLRNTLGCDFLRPGREPGDTAFSVPLDTFMSSQRGNWDVEQQSWQWREVESLPVADSMKLLGRVEHANVLLLAAMRGVSSAMPFAIRYASDPKVSFVKRQYIDAYCWTPTDKHVVKHVAGARLLSTSLLKHEVELHDRWTAANKSLNG